MRVLLLCLAAVGVLLAGPAVAEDSGLNKEGFWTVGRGDAEAKACMASIGGGDTPMLLVQIAPGHIDIVVGTPTPMRKGRQGVLTVGDQRFDFTPSYGDKRDVMYLDGVDGRAVEAMRKARWVSVMVDGRELVSVDLAATGVEAALDATAACSEGKSGWWGAGVGAVVSAAAGDQDPPLHKDGFWLIEAAEVPGACVAAARVDDLYSFAVIVAREGMSFGVNSTREMRRGSRGRLATDAYAFDFKPAYESKTYFYPAGDLDSRAAFALRRAKTVSVSMDGKPLIDMDFQGTGYPEVLQDLEACAAGEKGWWGAGAKQR